MDTPPIFYGSRGSAYQAWWDIEMEKLLDLILVYGEIPGSIWQAPKNKGDQGYVSVFSVVAKMFVT